MQRKKMLDKAGEVALTGGWASIWAALSFVPGVGPFISGVGSGIWSPQSKLLKRSLDEIKQLRSAYRLDKRYFKRLKSFARDTLGPEDFYGLRAGRTDMAWLSLLQDWDAPRSYGAEFVTKVRDANPGDSPLPVAVITGSGGSGKSVSLRRLAMQLYQGGGEVWWADSPDRLIHAGLPEECAAVAEGERYLLIDEIDRLTDDEAFTLLQQVLSNYQLKVVVAGRRIPPVLRGTDDQQLKILTDSHPDLPAILNKITAVIPEWSEVVKTIDPEVIKGPRLIQLLLVVARSAKNHQLLPATIHVETINRAFLKALASDLALIKQVSPGLQRAMIDTARLRDCNIDISAETMMGLVEAYQPGFYARELYLNGEKEAWAPLENLMFVSGEGGARFHHAELASGIVTAATQGMLGDDVIVNATTERLLLEHITRSGRPTEASHALFELVARHPDAAKNETTVALLDRLIKHNNPYHEYQQILYNKALPLTEDERIKRIAKLSKRGATIGGAQWVRRATQSHLERARLLQKLYDAGCRDNLFITEYIRHLDPSDRPIAAEKMIKGKTVTDNQKIIYLKLGGKRAKAYAKQLLLQPDSSLAVRTECIQLLGVDARPQARELIRDALEQGKDLTPFKVGVQALGNEGIQLAEDALLSDTLPPVWRDFCVSVGGKRAEAYAEAILQKGSAEPGLLAACIAKVGASHKSLVANILHSNHHPDIVGTCLKVLQQDAAPEAHALLIAADMPDSILAQCLRLAGPEGATQAKLLLKRSKVSSELRVECLKLLDADQARPYAIEQLHTWRECSNGLLMWCLHNASDSPEANDVINTLSSEWDRLRPDLRAVVLRVETNETLRRQRAEKIIKSWRYERRSLVSVALSVFNQSPDKNKQACKQILNEWRQELKFKNGVHERKSVTYNGHIIKALGHPGLRQMASQTAREMLQAEKKQPGTLSQLLYTRATDIVESKMYPVWR